MPNRRGEVASTSRSGSLDPATRIEAARLFGAVSVSILAQFAVSMPGGYFGFAETTTLFGASYSAALVLLLTATIRAWNRRSRWALVGAATIYATGVGFFIPAIPGNAVIAGAVVVWNFTLLSGILLGAPSGHGHRSSGSPALEDPLEEWIARTGPAARHLLQVALVSTVAVVGWEIAAKMPARVICMILQAVAAGASLRYLQLLQGGSRWVRTVALLLLASGAVAFVRPELALVLLIGFDLLVLLSLLVSSAFFHEVLQYFYGRPAVLIFVSFLVLIVLGSILLTFPVASAGPVPIEPIDAFFTATSAACVTGLIVLDTPHDLSFFGQAVVLGLIQVGGLNIMVLSAFAALLLGRGLGLRGDLALGNLLEVPSIDGAHRLIAFIVLATVAVEGVGAAVLTAAEVQLGTDLGMAVWRGVFHAVSAFCNAGFSLYSDSMIGFRENTPVLLVVALLITVGGIGFQVMAFAWLRLGRSVRVGLATQVRIVLVASVVLTFAGFGLFTVIEWGRGLAGLDSGHKLLNAFFQSVTCRTAGFNSVDLTDLHPATHLSMMALMFVGASPGGTGGGVKTTTLVVLLSAIPAIASGKSRVVVFRRSLSLGTVLRALAIGGVAGLVIFFGAVALLLLQGGQSENVIFEVVSAFGTVGLSLGTTAELETPGKLVVALLMLFGRVGPLSLALLFGRKAASVVGYPEARIMVG